MQLGKHVYVQKPLTRTVSEARALTEAARRYKVVTQMGNQGHSGEGVRLIEEWIADGAIGKVHEVHCWTNRPIWPQGMPRPTDTPPVPGRAGLGSVDRAGTDAAVPPGLPPLQLAFVVRLRLRRAGRHGVPRDGRVLQRAEARVPDQRARVPRVQGRRGRRGPTAPREPTGSSTRTASRPPRVVHYTFPARGRKLPGGEAALVRRRAAARTAGGARARSPAARERHDLRRREGQADVRDLLGEPAADPGDADEGVQAPEEDDSRASKAATSRTGSTPSRARRRRRRNFDYSGSVHRDRAAGQRGACCSRARSCCGTART